MCIFERLKKSLACLAQIVPVLVTLASIATALIPNPSAEEAATMALIHKILDIIALNSVGHNANDNNEIKID